MPIPSPMRWLACLFALVPAAAGAAGLEIRSEGQAASRWLPSVSVPPPSWPATAERSLDACVNLGYLIGRDGSTSSYVLLHAWGAQVPDGAEGRERLEPFVQGAAATLRRWHFRPAAANPRKRSLFTSASFVFAASPGADIAALRAHCAVGDLRDFIYQAQNRAYQRGNLGKGQLDRNRMVDPPMIPDGFVRHPGWLD